MEPVITPSSSFPCLSSSLSSSSTPTLLLLMSSSSLNTLIPAWEGTISRTFSKLSAGTVTERGRVACRIWDKSIASIRVSRGRWWTGYGLNAERMKSAVVVLFVGVLEEGEVLVVVVVECVGVSGSVNGWFWDFNFLEKQIQHNVFTCIHKTCWWNIHGLILNNFP